MTTDLEAESFLKLFTEKGIEVFTQHRLGNVYNGSSPIKFNVLVTNGKDELHTTYFVGSLIPIIRMKQNPRAFYGETGIFSSKDVVRACSATTTNICVDDAHIRYNIRKKFEPEPVDILQALMFDIRNIEGYDYWLEWAKDMDASIRDIEPFETMYKDSREARNFFKKALGENFDQALELACSF
jgi:hypothetical protein